MKPDDIRSALRDLDRIVVLGPLPQQVIVRARHRRFAFTAITACVSLTVVGVALAALPSDPLSDSAPIAPVGSQMPIPVDSNDDLRVTTSVEPSKIGTLAVSVSAVKDANLGDAGAWVEHELVFDNLANDQIRFEDTRSSIFLPDAQGPMIIAADEGCGYGSAGQGSAVEAGACDRYLDVLVLGANESESRTITLFKGLPGMEPLRPGRYVFTKMLRYTVGQSETHIEELRIIYTVERGD